MDTATPGYVDAYTGCKSQGGNWQRPEGGNVPYSAAGAVEVRTNDVSQ